MIGCVTQQLFAFGLDYFFTAIKSARADMVAQMSFARCRFDGSRRVGQKIMGTVHTAFGWGLLILLNSHVNYS